MSKRQTLGYKGQLFTLDLSYLGWSILGSLPGAVYSAAFSWHMAQAGYGYLTGDPAALSQTFTVLGLPDWGWTLVMGLWSLVVALFYLANYQCVELGYFEAAKRSSGVGEGARPRQDQAPWNGGMGPDGLGGF